mmetsp:Transcript_2532/g.5269  ORF Transcript_2532/g.5269 Transcript_2532/m.5269 type:complete len:458 (-) Transcript_2532:114-1487(-)
MANVFGHRSRQEGQIYTRILRLLGRANRAGGPIQQAESRRQLRNLQKLGNAILLVHSLQACLGGTLVKLHQLLCAWPDLCLCDASVVLKSNGERVATKGFQSSVHCRSREERAAVLKHRVLRQRQLRQEVSEKLALLVGTSCLQVTCKEVERGGHSQVEPETVQDLLLHVQDLLAVVSLVRDVHEVADLRGPDLLILCCKKHGRYANELQILAADRVLGEETINQVGGQEERLGHKLELKVNLHEPVDEDGAHLVVDVSLLPHVIQRHLRVRLDAAPVAVDVVHILCASEGIITVGRVNVRHLHLRLASRRLAAAEQKTGDTLVVGTIQGSVGRGARAVVTGLECGCAAASRAPGLPRVISCARALGLLAEVVQQGSHLLALAHSGAVRLGSIGAGLLQTGVAGGKATDNVANVSQSLAGGQRGPMKSHCVVLGGVGVEDRDEDSLTTLRQYSSCTT